jgi:serine/threonine protein phosphatase PrpC
MHLRHYYCISLLTAYCIFLSAYALGTTGDSVALLARDGACQRLTVDHRADNAAEMLRVLNAGGELEYDDCGTLRLYRPSDLERRNGCMFTRCVFAVRAARCTACYVKVVLLQQGHCVPAE